MLRGAIILCGGRSSRMGGDKALLPFGPHTMLEQVVSVVAEAVDAINIVVVAAEGQQLPRLSPEVIIARDEGEYRGPLVAVRTGFKQLPPKVDCIFITGCDTPLLESSVIELLFGQIGESDAIVPQDSSRCYPLCAVYHTRVREAIDGRLSLGDHSLHGWTSRLDTKLEPTDSLRAVDPRLLSLRNVNTQEDYVAALSTAGFSTP